MAGHSKWKQIKRKKAVTDQRRGAHFTKLIKEITVAARQGGGDPNGNARLRTAIDAAKTNNMPADNIDRAIKKGTGGLEGVIYQDVMYEGYGPGGAAILIECTTDNPTRTVADLPTTEACTLYRLRSNRTSAVEEIRAISSRYPSNGTRTVRRCLRSSAKSSASK